MARVKTNPILLISPLDPTGLSGLVRDAILLNQLGKTSITICTAVANQNDIEIDDVTPLSFEEIKRQLDAIGRRYWLDWAVISGVHELNMASAIIRYLEHTRPGIHILWNPVLQHTERAYKQSLLVEEQHLFETLCKKVHTVFLESGDLHLFHPAESTEDLLQAISHDCFIYLSREGNHDTLYQKGMRLKQPATIKDTHRYTFLSALSSFLYDGNEMSEACSKSLLFLSGKPIN